MMKLKTRWPLIISIVLSLYLAVLLITGSPHGFANNIFLINFTFIGDGIFIAAIIALLYSKKQILKAQSLLLAVIITTVVIQLSKNLIFNDGLHFFLEEGEYLHAQNGIDLAGMPSSHMAYGMAFFTLIFFYFSKIKWTIAIAMIAIVLAYSRIYLSGNTVVDVVVGGVTGLLSALLSYSILFPVRKTRASAPRWGKTATLPH